MPPKPKTSEDATEALLDDLLGRLRLVALPEEDHTETLKRLVGDSAALRRLIGTGETRLLVVEHLGPVHTSFDTGGQYAVRWVMARSGEVVESNTIMELGVDSKPTASMRWNVAEDHLTDRIDRWLKPEAYR
jgi:hypothetical protein